MQIARAATKEYIITNYCARFPYFLAIRSMVLLLMVLLLNLS